jgi:hypothetical protein
MTPFFVVFNVAAILRHHDTKQPSEHFRKLVTVKLAKSLANQ